MAPSILSTLENIFSVESVTQPINNETKFYSYSDVRQRTEPDLVSVRHAADDPGEAAAVLDVDRARHFWPGLSDDGRPLLGSHLNRSGR